MTISPDIDRSLDLANRALAKAKENEMAATPRNFEIWFHYLAGENKPLVDAIKNALADGQKITETVAGKLHNDFITPDRNSDDVAELSGQISSEVESAIAMIGAAAGSNHAFGDSLGGVCSQLGGITKAEDLQRVTETLVLASREMERNSLDLEKKLNESKKQISALKENLDEVRNESRTDALTGIPNRKAFDEAFIAETANAAETNEELCLVVADIDHFKKFNDTHGHQTGDKVLQLVAKLLASNVKGRDMAARFGGEEFTVLLPQTNLRAAVTVADQMREQVLTKELVKKSTNENLGTITMSFGVARFRPGESMDELFHRADACLYAAKNDGRNNVKCEADPGIDLNIKAA